MLVWRFQALRSRRQAACQCRAGMPPSWPRRRNGCSRPVKPEGRAIAKSFWGQAWCDNLESYSDFANRLPRGRTYVRNGSVIDLQIERGKVKAIVSGSEIYRVTIAIRTLAKPAWKRIKQDCSQSIDSLIDLLARAVRPGRHAAADPAERRALSAARGNRNEVHLPRLGRTCASTSPPCSTAWARVWTRRPSCSSRCANVDHLELISQAVAAENLEATLTAGQNGALADSDLGELFGIELDSGNGKSDKAAKEPASRKRPTASVLPKPAPAKPAATKRALSRAPKPKPTLKKPTRGEAKRKPLPLHCQGFGRRFRQATRRRR